MPSVEDDIVKHLHLCAALMSDPFTMQNHPETVVDQFSAAMARIEHLQLFLPPPADACARASWLDSSILGGGIKRMVSLTLAKHMEPLRWMHPRKKAAIRASREGLRTAEPLIFIKEFQSADGKGRKNRCRDTDFAQEIKENNCMAALVLLYYYLHWHVLLILLNRRLHPCIGGRPSGGDLDVAGMLSRLPSFFDTFELRPLHATFAKSLVSDECGHTDGGGSSDDDGSEPEGDGDGGQGAGGSDMRGKQSAADTSGSSEGWFDGMLEKMKTFFGSCVSDGYMFSAEDKWLGVQDGTNNDRRPRERQAKLMELYRVVMACTAYGKRRDHMLEVAHKLGYEGSETQTMKDYNRMILKNERVKAYRRHLAAVIVNARELAARNNLMITAGALSIYSLQDDTDKWYDMYRQIQIKSNLGMVSSTTRMITTMIEVLKLHPYSVLNDDRKVHFKLACIHDFNSASLMMDICGSFLKMHELIGDMLTGSVTDQGISEKLLSFVAQTYMSDMALRKVLTEHADDTARPPNLEKIKSKMFAVPRGNLRESFHMTDDLRQTASEVNLIEMAGPYWGARMADHFTVNHVYFTWPYAETDNFMRNGPHLVNRYIKMDPKDLEGGEGDKTVAFVFPLVLGSGLRNSLYMSSMIQSLLRLIDTLRCTSLLERAVVEVRESDMVHRTLHSTRNYFGEGFKSSLSYFLNLGELENSQSPKKYSRLTIDHVIAELRSEEKALTVRIEKARRGLFKMYPPLSWPYAEGVENNYEAFTVIGNHSDNSTESRSASGHESQNFV